MKRLRTWMVRLAGLLPNEERERELADEIEEDPWDPAPRHGDHVAGSLAIAAPFYDAIGGLPPATGALAPMTLPDGRPTQVPLLPITLDGERPGGAFQLPAAP